MYFEADLRGEHYKVDVIETRVSWKVAMHSEKSGWKHFEILKTDYRKSESYFSFLFEGSSYLIDVIGKDTEYTVFTRNSYRTVSIFNDEMLLHESLKRGGGFGGNSELCSGMPGKIIEIFVKPGDVVKANKPLLIMEAMKMENEMRSSDEVTVKEVCVKQGDSVETGQVLIRFEPS